MGFGPKVRERRTALGFSQEHLAHEAGISLNAVHKLEMGRISDPHYSTLSAIAHALGTTVAELVGKEELAVPLIQLVGVEELDELLARVGSRTQNLCDPQLVSDLQSASDAAVSRAVRQTRQELELLIPELSRLGDGLEPGDDGFMSYNRALAWASQQVLAFDFFLRGRDGEQPEEVAAREVSRALLELALAG